MLRHNLLVFKSDKNSNVFHFIPKVTKDDDLKILKDIYLLFDDKLRADIQISEVTNNLGLVNRIYSF